MFYIENKKQIDEKKYRPLPSYLTIYNSRIDGLGLYTIKDIPAGKNLGMTHAKRIGEIDNLLRTPLGGFINHSEKPNCEIKGKITRYLFTTEDIKANTELTVKYTMYSV